ncbi:MAG: phosphatidylserine decarboxylase [Pseudomonadota bacterium]
MSETDYTRKRFPWLRSGFDLEGYVGALAGILIAMRFSFLPAFLSWLGIFGWIAAIIILFATRTAERTAPQEPGLIVTPTDGLIVSVDGATPPDELRLEGPGWQRVRISIGPTKTNGIHAPMDGAIDHVIRESGDPAAFAAMKPDRPGLAVAYVSLESGARAVGMRLATGGLGPRLEINNEAGDAVRLGRNIGTLRLGGWCDLYVPAGIEVLPKPGQTLIGSETIIGRFGSAGADLFEREDEIQTPEPVPEVDEEEPVEAELVMDEEDELTLEKLAGKDEAPEEPDEEDVSEMFARLRKEARKAQDDD